MCKCVYVYICIYVCMYMYIYTWVCIYVCSKCMCKYIQYVHVLVEFPWKLQHVTPALFGT